MVVGKSHFAADIVVVEVHLQSRHGHDLQTGSLRHVRGTRVHQAAGEIARGDFAQVLAVTVGAKVVHCFAVLHQADGTQGQAVAVEFRAADAALGLTCHGDADGVAGGVLLDGVALLEQVGVGIDR